MRVTTLVLTLAMVPLGAQPVDLTGHLHRTRKLFLDSVAGLSEAQWKFKPAPERWSIAECAEHITVTEDFLFNLIRGKAMQGPAPAEDLSAKDSQIIGMVTDRSRKAQAPEPARPTGRWPTTEALLRQFGEWRDRTISFAETNRQQLRAHTMPHPAGFPADVHQWLLFLSGHVERHVKQIEEVKGHPDYPKK